MQHDDRKLLNFANNIALSRKATSLRSDRSFSQLTCPYTYFTFKIGNPETWVEILFSDRYSAQITRDFGEETWYRIVFPRRRPSRSEWITRQASLIICFICKACREGCYILLYLAWDVSPVASTPFVFLLLFFSYFFLCCIMNLYCILQEEYPIKRWEKKLWLFIRGKC